VPGAACPVAGDSGPVLTRFSAFGRYFEATAATHVRMLNDIIRPMIMSRTPEMTSTLCRWRLNFE
jgi:hypothetical protein